MNIKELVNQAVEENDKWSDEQYCLRRVKQDGLALQYVKKQTPEICLAVVKQDGFALKYVKKQTPEICLAAVKEDGYALQYVREQTPEICAAAVKQNPDAVEYIVLPSEPEARKQFIKEFAFYLNQEG